MQPASPIEFLLFLGDFVYADVPWSLGKTKEAYTRLYRRNYASQSYRKVYEKIPVFHIYDDHEFVNNFAGQGNDSAPFINASYPFQIYHGQANYDSENQGDQYFTFNYGDAAFFVLDTRRYRSAASVEPAKRTLLGEKQLGALYSWLGKVNSTSTYKFVVSSVPFTTLWKGDSASDSWGGFPTERDALLATLSTVPNTFILSGDRHEFAAIEQLGPSTGKVIELSSSPMSMFWLPLPGWMKMRPNSQRLVHRPATTTQADEQTSIESNWLPEESLIKYIPVGAHKWSTIEIDTTDPQHPSLSIELLVNGKPVWKHLFPGQPVEQTVSTAIGVQISGFFQGVLNRVPQLHNPIAKYLSG